MKRDLTEHFSLADLPGAKKGGVRARGRNRHEPVTMNKLETEYSQYLKDCMAAGDIIWWGFECIKFRLGHNCFYNPDFLVQTADGFMEIHETKGFMEEDALVKIKTVATMFPMLDFVIVRKKPVKEGGGWSFEEVKR